MLYKGYVFDCCWDSVQTCGKAYSHTLDSFQAVIQMQNPVCHNIVYALQ